MKKILATLAVVAAATACASPANAAVVGQRCVTRAEYEQASIGWHNRRVGDLFDSDGRVQQTLPSGGQVKTYQACFRSVEVDGVSVRRVVMVQYNGDRAARQIGLVS